MRRPARLEPAGVLDFRDRIWAAIRAFGRDVPFSVAEIMVLSGQSTETVTRYLAGLTKAGFTENVHSYGRPQHMPRQAAFRMFSLARDIGVEAPRVYKDGKPITRSIGHDRMWRAMRTARGEFTWREIVLHASTEDRPIGAYVAKDYIKHVARAGYLRVVSPAHSTRPASYAFVRARDTGPRSPIVAEDKSVRDGNTGELMLAAPGGRAHG